MSFPQKTETAVSGLPGEPRLSIIICCHNSGARLEPTLAHLAVQTGISADRWEVVLVDNASTDGTAERAIALWQKDGAPTELRIATETTLGIFHARVAGIAAARYEILSFVDDDNWVCPTWCATALALMKTHSDLGVIGAHSEAVFETGQVVPAWFASLQHGYAVGPQAEKSGWIGGALPRFYGAGLTLRRDAVRTLFENGFSGLLTGRSGDRLTAGDDSELCYALGFYGWRFWYEDSMRLKHFMPPGRLTATYAQRLFHGLGFSCAMEHYYFRALPMRGAGDLAARAKLFGPIPYVSATRHLLRHLLRIARSNPGSADRLLAEIESSYFKGVLAGLSHYRKSSRAIVAHIAGWAGGARDRKKRLG